MCQWYERNRALMRLWLHLIGLAVVVAVLALFIGFLASQAPDFWRWPIGLGFAVGVGQFACPRFLRVLRNDYMRMKKPVVLGHSRPVPSSLVGVSESLVFSVAVGNSYGDTQSLAGVFAAMGIWLGAKMLAGWNRDASVIIINKSEREKEQWLEERSRGAFSALLAGVLNLAIATVGGNIAADGIVVSDGVAVFGKIADWILRFLTEGNIGLS